MLAAQRLIVLALIFHIAGVTAPHVATNRLRSKSIQTRIVERIIHLDPPGANDSRYTYVPFSVPLNAVRISISYQYDRADGKNAIDIGLFDARSTGSEPDLRGFRGWSGGRRSEFFVSPDVATPGYLAGEIYAGAWRIILGLYRVAAAGVDVSLRVAIEADEKISSRLSLRRTRSTFHLIAHQQSCLLPGAAGAEGRLFFKQRQETAHVGGVAIFICTPSTVTASGPSPS